MIPVILRPCDWESSRFGKLQALPKDGKPVVDWKTEDHGFLNVVKGLRSVAKELRRKPVAVKTASAAAAPRRWRPLVATVAALIVALTSGAFWLVHRRHIEQAAQEAATHQLQIQQASRSRRTR